MQKFQPNQGDFASIVTLYENYFMKIFKLDLKINEVNCLIKPLGSQIKLENGLLKVDCLCFDTSTHLSFDKLTLRDSGYDML